jgi:hypothetical protein
MDSSSLCDNHIMIISKCWLASTVASHDCRVSDPDQHYFELLDPDPQSNCGSVSGSRRAKMTHKNRKKYRIFMF